MDEFDDLDEYYFSKKRDPNQMKDARLRGLYEYSEFLKVPRAKGAHVPYRLIAQLASVAPPGGVVGFVLKRLTAYGMVSSPSAELSTRIDWANKWQRREGKGAAEVPVLGDAARKAISDFATALPELADEEAVQDAAFGSAKKYGLRPGEFFPAVYSILLGSDRGPRLGPYVMDAGKAEVSRLLLEAAGK